MTTERRMITIDERTLDGSVNAVAKLTDRVIALEAKLATAERDRKELTAECVVLQMDRDAHAARAQDLARRVTEVERERDAKDRGCPVHAGTIHGGEAEELRAGIEAFVETYGKGEDTYGICSRMQRLLDRVDARDSLAHLERTDLVKACSDRDRAIDALAARVAEVMAERDELEEGLMVSCADAVDLAIQLDEVTAARDAALGLAEVAVDAEPVP